LRPDGKSQVTIEYREGKPYRLHTIVVSSQHSPDVSLKQLRKDLFTHLQSLPVAFFDRNPAGELMSRLTNDIDAINQAVSQNVTSLIASVLSMVGILVAMFVLDRWLALADWLATAPLEGLAATLYAHLQLTELLRPTSARHGNDVADAQMLLARLVDWQTAHGQTGADGWRNALDLLALGGLNALGETADPARDAVALLTLHAAKGLEFRHVFISGCNQGVIPLQSAWGNAEIEAEERRLLFVGLTRAKDSVELSYHNQPAHPQAAPVPSPYLYQLPAHTVDWQDRAPEPPPAPVAAPVAADPELPWPVGQRVRHPRYGLGTVKCSDAALVEVQFEKFGERSFDRLLCPLIPAE